MATKTFTVTVEDSTEDEVLEAHVKGFDWKLACDDFAQWLRSKIKYTDEEEIKIEDVREKFFEILGERDLTL